MIKNIFKMSFILFCLFLTISCGSTAPKQTKTKTSDAPKEQKQSEQKQEHKVQKANDENRSELIQAPKAQHHKDRNQSQLIQPSTVCELNDQDEPDQDPIIQEPEITKFEDSGLPRKVYEAIVNPINIHKPTVEQANALMVAIAEMMNNKDIDEQERINEIKEVARKNNYFYSMNWALYINGGINEAARTERRKPDQAR